MGNITSSSKLAKYDNIFIILGILSLLASTLIPYIYGANYYDIIDMCAMSLKIFIFIFLLVKISQIMLITTGVNKFKYFSSIFIILYILQITSLLIRIYLIYEIFDWILHGIILIITVLIIINFKKINFIAIGENVMAIQGHSEENYLEKNEIHNGLGIGEKTIDKVIYSICKRANSSLKMNTISLITMIVIVVVGVTASFGTVALNQAQKVREIEQERGKLNALISNLKESEKNGTYDTDVIKNIVTNYGNDKDYSELIKNSLKQDYDWIDIAMRATIALLTIFLVQIFFHIYKFNQHQASHLYGRAETYELFKSNEESEKELREALLAKLESSPAYGKSPSAPTEQIIEALKNLKG